MDNILLSRLIGGKISDISRSCNLISIQVDVADKEKIFLHIQSFFRILKKGILLISSEDMYRCEKKCDEENFDWDIPGKSIFDATVKTSKPQLFNSKIIQVQKNNNDLIIILENDLIIQIFIDTTESEEKYRIFDKNESMIVYS